MILVEPTARWCKLDQTLILQVKICNRSMGASTTVRMRFPLEVDGHGFAFLSDLLDRNQRARTCSSVP